MAAAHKIAVSTLTGAAAGPATVLAALPTARVAHLATHGFFADPKFRSVLQVDPKLFEMCGERARRGREHSPLVLSGLVFAGANRPETPGRGMVTGEAPRRPGPVRAGAGGVEACETGLGDVAGGEGVFGLQRAFHLAGCKNVVASLWKVDDAATAALMGLFYRGLWVENLSPREALRQAQLTLYRNPGLIPVLAASARAGLHRAGFAGGRRGGPEGRADGQDQPVGGVRAVGSRAVMALIKLQLCATPRPESARGALTLPESRAPSRTRVAAPRCCSQSWPPAACWPPSRRPSAAASRRPRSASGSGRRPASAGRSSSAATSNSGSTRSRGRSGSSSTASAARSRPCCRFATPTDPALSKS